MFNKVLNFIKEQFISIEYKGKSNLAEILSQYILFDYNVDIFHNDYENNFEKTIKFDNFKIVYRVNKHKQIGYILIYDISIYENDNIADWFVYLYNNKIKINNLSYTDKFNYKFVRKCINESRFN